MSATAARRRHRHDVPADCPLTSGEYKVLKGASDGLTQKQIAHQLGRSSSTIRGLSAAACHRLGVSNATQAVIRCLKAGWFDVDITPEPEPENPDDAVTPAQALYLEAFQRWLQSGDPDDRAEAKTLLRIVRRQGHDQERRAA